MSEAAEAAESNGGEGAARRCDLMARTLGASALSLITNLLSLANEDDFRGEPPYA